MIDIIIINNNDNNLQSTLVSIALQSKIKLKTIYIWQKNTVDNKLINLFSKKFKICIRKYKNQTDIQILKEYQRLKKKANFSFFMRGKDILYNSFSLYSIYTSLKEKKYDVANGNMIKEMGKDYLCISNRQSCLYGRLYNNRFIEKILKQENISSITELKPKTVFTSNNVYIYKK